MAYDDVDVTADGDQVHVRTSVRGTMPDGKAVALTTNVLLDVRDEQIVGLEGRLAPEDQQVIGELLMAGGFEIPAALRDQLAGAEGST